MGQVARKFQVRSEFAILFLALVLRLAFLLLAGFDAPLAGDELAYQQIAVNLAAGRGFVQTNNPFFPGQVLYAWQAPLYPLSLGALYALFGPHPVAGKLFGILVGVLTIWVTYDLSRRVLPHSKRGPVLAALFVAVYPGFLTNAHLLLSETLFAFLLVLAFDLLAAALVNGASDLLLKRGWKGLVLLLAAGAVWGLATLTRGVTLYFIAPLALWLVLVALKGYGAFVTRSAIASSPGASSPSRVASLFVPGNLSPRLRSALVAAAVFAVAMFAVIAPWTLRNYALFHQVVLLETKGGVNFWLGNSPYTPDDFIRNVWKTGVREPILEPLPQDEIIRDHTAYSLGLAYVAREPLIFFARLPVKFADFWGFERNLVDVAEATHDNKPGGWNSVSKVAADFISDAALVLVVLLAIGGFLFAPDDAWKLLLGGFVLYFVIVHVVVFGDGRFHFPLIPFLAIYGAWFAADGLGSRAYSRPRLVAALLLALVFMAVWGHEMLAALRALGWA